ncbi:multidrug transporter [Bhargavaea cecembensis]|uniref:Multidrug transporter n=1 Tax=Bhargavaea cecembensis TaxID=394098 RepID=A0A165GIM3_9BACL|nr:multidrug transporter [Bhargavaea cecembensis]
MNWLKEWKKKVSGFSRNVRLFILANILIQIGMGVFAVMYNLYIKALGMPETVNGSIISMTALATAIILIPAGLLSDRFGRKWLLIGGSAFTMLTLFYRSVETAESTLVAAAFVTGLTMAFVQVSGVPFLAENSTASERVHLFSLYFSLVTVAGVIGSLGGGVIADVLEKSFGLFEVEAIRWSLLAGSAVFTAGILPLFFLSGGKKSEQPQVTADRIPDPPEPGEPDEASLSRNVRLIFHLGLANLLIGLGSGLVIPYLNLYFANRFGASNAYIGLILSLGSAMTAVAMMIGPALVKRVGKVKALIFFQLTSIPFLFLTAYTMSLGLASLGFLMRQALMNAGNPIQSAISMEIVHDKYKGLANSVNQTVFQVGWAAMGPVSAGLVVAYGSYWGYAWAFTITGVLYMISSIYYYMVFGRRKLAGE